jgi:hypothetical protein
LDQTVLIFDPINFRVSYHNVSVQLQPLSFKLLEKLAETPGEIQSVDELTTAVWGDIRVSTDTLKQRVFVLRKALIESELSQISIQAVRNEGYRLLIAQEAAPERTARPGYHWRAGALAAVMSLILLSGWWFSRDIASSNNRLVLWSNIPQSQMPVAIAGVYEEWRSLLIGNNRPENFQLIFSALQQDVALPIQARKSRAALISYFEVVNLENSAAIRLSIIEGSTATVLRSEILPLPDTGYRQSLQQQFNSIEALIGSGLLHLQPAQRENARDPIWQHLTQLANQP